MTGGAHVDVGADRWELTFSQPASDYLEFRNRLDQQNLSLENVVVREADQQLVGSIKVNPGVKFKYSEESWDVLRPKIAFKKKQNHKKKNSIID